MLYKVSDNLIVDTKAITAIEVLKHDNGYGGTYTVGRVYLYGGQCLDLDDRVAGLRDAWLLLRKDGQ